MKALELFLGILTAVGGFVEIGELTFALNAGSKFDFSLLWIVALGTIGIIVYGEMAGRVAAVRKQPVFHLIRERAGLTAGLVTLIAANLVNLLTCAAEIGGIALVWQLMTGWANRPLVAATFALLALAVWFLPFKWIERVFGLLGLLMVVFVAAAVAAKPDWGQVAGGFMPQLPKAASPSDKSLYAYFGVALFSSIVLPYETYFYASGAIEDRWTTKDLKLNRIIIIVARCWARRSASHSSFSARSNCRRGASKRSCPAPPRWLPASRSGDGRSSPHWSGCCSLSVALPSKRHCQAPTTWPNSSAGRGASSASRGRRPAFTRPGSFCCCCRRS
jgi:hypothetical protein